MTREEAVSIIKERIHLTEYIESSYVDCVDIEALRIAIEALERPPVIRCGECEHWKHNDNFVQGKCKVTKLHPKRDWFCGSGEPRRGGEQ